MFNWLKKKLIKLNKTSQNTGQENLINKPNLPTNFGKASMRFKEQGDAYLDLGNFAAAIGSYRQAIAYQQGGLVVEYDNIELLFSLGVALEGSGQQEEAQTCYLKLLSINSKHVFAHCKLGRIRHVQCRFSEAIEHYGIALTIDANFTIARLYLSDTLSFQGEYTKAIACYDEILKLAPEHVSDARHNKSLALLTLGKFQDGWHEYEYRWLCSGSVPAPSFSQPAWTGQEILQGKTIFVYHEQGFGDTLQFIRYAKLLAERGALVQVLVPHPLKSLVANSAEISAVFVIGDALPDFDYHCALMSLPLAFKTDLTTIPATIPYLTCTKEDSAYWQMRLGEKCNFRVGLVWAGSTSQITNHLRSIHFDQMRPLLNITGIDFFSLQLGDEAVAQLKGEPRVINYTSEIKDYKDTAALMENLDLVICVDTSVAHLAGAIGKPVWILNRYNTCWRWLLDRTDSPWYPTARLFRQPSFGDWDSVIVDVKNALENLVADPQRLQP